MRSDGNICPGTAPAGTTVLHELTFKTLDALNLCAKKNVESLFDSFFPLCLELAALEQLAANSLGFTFTKHL